MELESILYLMKISIIISHNILTKCKDHFAKTVKV